MRIRCLLLLTLGTVLVAQADPLQRGTELTRNGDEQERQAQQRIDDLDAATRQMWLEHEAAERELRSLRGYRQHLETQHTVQGARLDELRTQLDELEHTREGVVPLMLEMLERLKTLVGLRPFDQDARQSRLAAIERSLRDPTVELAEQYRQLIGGYLAELEYATSLGVERSELELDGGPRQVDLVRIGLLALYYLSLDGQRVGLWRDDGQAFVPLSPRSAVLIERARRLALEQTAPSLLMLPLVVPDGVTR
ncbi:MAG: DUF3450 domain-containing protein [Gammaproteobacteria bacterium]|nr:DUF3450 domain-containing protein [Gammaproteobacteria bacterium]